MAGTGAGPSSGRGRSPPTPRRLGYCEVWLRTSQEGIYYRFLGEQIKCYKPDYHRIRVPALDRIFETHHSARGPWRKDWWDTLTGVLHAPVLSSKWVGTRESLEAVVGMSKKGDTMPQYMWHYLRQQEPT